ncbi:NUDIX hydrolase [Sanguibacter antarcticus]|uniref:ADP-ribose pyrophosphatase YjhB (NUDIX family) n=1 Tax=Sanguibacter antarcticus TaxID=372484 RepID=A0A2A9E6S6_9MICO|nr:NUDIX domain-containing protein [Sanguibacter antarcticus]PFG34346.1 ADP-ribose pyrophosphatase YjhB (NUDIX family) [Sanguibacter antarcticus]
MTVPPFISALRAHIGTDMLWLPGVSGVVLDEAGRILLAQRADDALWTVVSGVLEPGEEPAVGLAREVLEETGVTVHVEAFSALSVTGPVVYPNGDQTQYVDLCFVCRPLDAAEASAAHVADDESLAVGWFGLDDLPKALSPTSRDRITWTLAFLSDPAAGPRFAR